MTRQLPPRPLDGSPVRGSWTVDSGYAIANTIHTTGRAIVWSGLKEPAELYWSQLRDAGLTMAPLEKD